MTTTLGTLTNQIATMVQEDTSFSTGLWTLTEIYRIIHHIAQDFCALTRCLTTVTSQTTSAAREFDYPGGIQEIERLAFDNVPLDRVTRMSLDREDRDWRTKSGRPRRYHTDHLALDRFELDRTLTAGLVALGNFHVVGTTAPTEVTNPANNLTVPDYTVPYIKYGTLWIMLSKEGEGQDLARAQYCRLRYRRGINLYRRLMGMEPLEEPDGE